MCSEQDESILPGGRVRCQIAAKGGSGLRFREKPLGAAADGRHLAAATGNALVRGGPAGEGVSSVGRWPKAYAEQGREGRRKAGQAARKRRLGGEELSRLGRGLLRGPESLGQESRCGAASERPSGSSENLGEVYAAAWRRLRRICRRRRILAAFWEQFQLPFAPRSAMRFSRTALQRNALSPFRSAKTIPPGRLTSATIDQNSSEDATAAEVLTPADPNK